MRTGENARIAEKMINIKAIRDRITGARIAEKGLIMVPTGAGKGKSSSGAASDATMDQTPDALADRLETHLDEPWLLALAR